MPSAGGGDWTPVKPTSAIRARRARAPTTTSSGLVLNSFGLGVSHRFTDVYPPNAWIKTKTTIKSINRITNQYNQQIKQSRKYSDHSKQPVESNISDESINTIASQPANSINQ
jgi:hypothetical protein